jgi:glucokinase
MDPLIIGIDLGGTKIGTGLVGAQGQVLASDYRATETGQGKDVVIERMIDSVQQVLAQANTSITQLTGIGIGAPGPLDIPHGLLIEPPNLPGWVNVPLRQIIHDEFRIPTWLENDANAAAIGEYLYGAGQGTQHMIYITVSTGIGGGLILDSKIYHGIQGGAGEIGHMTILPQGPRCGCGNRGCLEALASGTAIAREGQALLDRSIPTLIEDNMGGDSQHVSAKDVVRAMSKGDRYAAEIVDRAMYYLGIGMANLVNLFNPERLVIGGGLTHLGDRLLDPVRRSIALCAFPSAVDQLTVTLAELGVEVGIVGAAGAAVMAARSD